MNRDVLEDTVALADKVGHAFVATADAEGLSHLAAVGAVSIEAADQLGVTSGSARGR